MCTQWFIQVSLWQFLGAQKSHTGTRVAININSVSLIFHSALITGHKRELALLLIWIMVVIFFPWTTWAQFLPATVRAGKNDPWANYSWPSVFLSVCILLFVFYIFKWLGENQTQKNKIYWWHVTIIGNSTSVKFIGTQPYSFLHALSAAAFVPLWPSLTVNLVVRIDYHTGGQK